MWKWGFGVMLWRSDSKGGFAVLKRGNFSGFQGCEKEGEVKLEVETDEDRRTWWVQREERLRNQQKGFTGLRDTQRAIQGK